MYFKDDRTVSEDKMECRSYSIQCWLKRLLETYISHLGRVRILHL